MLFYYKRKAYTNPQEYPKARNCPVCGGRGQREDARTGHLRDCVACNSSGIIKPKIKTI